MRMPAEERRLEGLRQAAEALGLDPAILLAALDAPKEPEPEPEPLPELTLEPLSDAEWAVLEPALLRHRRYLSKIPPRDFVNAVLWLAAYKFEFTLLPLNGGWSAAAIRDKLARESRARLWSALLGVAEKSAVFCEERLKLFERLVSYERAALARSERLRIVRLKKLAKGEAAVARRPFRAAG
jgi:transposase